MQGHHRNIFIENGMVSTVTSWHKGYTVTGSTKIIHRYVPNQVGELIIYYLWLILPFWQELEVLARRRTTPPSPFLWPKAQCQGRWHNRRLGEVIREAFKRELGLEMTVPLQTHASKYLLYIFRRNNLIGLRSATHPGRPYSPSVCEVSMQNIIRSCIRACGTRTTRTSVTSWPDQGILRSRRVNWSAFSLSRYYMEVVRGSRRS
jgi:hypothetical protein